MREPAKRHALGKKRQGDLAGVMLVQMRTGDLNSLLTNDGQWEKIGLGRTGETYLVGADKLMRSDKREIIVDPEAFIEQQRRSGAVAARQRGFRQHRRRCCRRAAAAAAAAAASLAAADAH